MNQQQLEYLRFLSEHENITIQVIPGQAPQLGALQGSFTLLSFPDKDEPDLTQVEHPIGPTLTQDLEQVAFLGRTFATLTKYAMSPLDSRDYVNKLIADV